MIRHMARRSSTPGHRVTRVSLLAALLVALPTSLAHAQSLDAVVMGTLSDAGGAALHVRR